MLLEDNKLKINDLKRDIVELKLQQDKLEGRVCDLEDKVVNLDKAHSKLETLTASLTETIGKLDGKLDNIVEEIQRLSTQLAVNETKQSLSSIKDKDNDMLIDSLFESNNKILLYLVIILGVGFLFLLGMRVESISKILGGM